MSIGTAQKIGRFNSRVKFKIPDGFYYSSFFIDNIGQATFQSSEYFLLETDGGLINITRGSGGIIEVLVPNITLVSGYSSSDDDTYSQELRLGSNTGIFEDYAKTVEDTNLPIEDPCEPNTTELTGLLAKETMDDFIQFNVGSTIDIADFSTGCTDREVSSGIFKVLIEKSGVDSVSINPNMHAFTVIETNIEDEHSD